MAKKPLSVRASLLAFLVSICPGAHALCFTGGGCWNPVNPVPGTFNPERVIWNGDIGEYLALGEGGAILTSPDGTGWTPRDSGTTQRLYGALWDGTQYLATGEGGLMLASPDGALWTPVTTNTRLAIFDVAWNGDSGAPVYVAVAQNGALLTSRDARDWARRDIGASSTGVPLNGARPTLRSIVWGGVGANSGFVAVGTSGAIASGTNGIDWHVNNYASGSGPFLRDVAVNPDGLFVAVGAQGSVFASQGITDLPWPAVPTPYPDAELRGIAWDAATNRFIAVGGDPVEGGGAMTGLILASAPNGEFGGSTSVGVAGEMTLKTVATDGAGSAVAAADRIILNGILNDGPEDLNWSALIPPPELTRALQDVIHVGLPQPVYLAVGAQAALLASLDGFAWTAIEIDTGNGQPTLNGIAWNGDEDQPSIVVVGDGGTLLRSADGLTWSPAASSAAVPAALAAVAYGDDQFVAVGQAGAALTSADGDAWSPVTPAAADVDLHGLAWNGTVYVAVGDQGRIVTSADGASWVPRDSGTAARLNAVIWTGQRFVAAGSETVLSGTRGVLLISEDGDAWEPASLPAGGLPGLLDLASGQDQLMGVTTLGTFVRSANGGSWTSLGESVGAEDSPVDPIHALAWDGDRFIAAGDAGIILNSGGVDIAVSMDQPEEAGFVPFGQPKTFHFDVVNVGNLDALGVVFSYALPAGSAFSEPTIAAPQGQTCQITGNAAQCLIGRLLPGTAASVPIELTVTGGAQATVQNTVEVVTSSNELQLENNVLAFSTQVGPPSGPPLPSPDTPFEGGALDYWLLLLLGFALLLADRRRRGAPPAPV